MALVRRATRPELLERNTMMNTTTTTTRDPRDQPVPVATLARALHCSWRTVYLAPEEERPTLREYPAFAAQIAASRTVRETARALGVHPNSIRGRIDAGSLPTLTLLGKTRVLTGDEPSRAATIAAGLALDGTEDPDNLSYHQRWLARAAFDLDPAGHQGRAALARAIEAAWDRRRKR